VIAFIGSVFSPYYAWARRRGSTDPLNHCALNVALYGAGGKRWSMIERGRSAVRQEARCLTIGPSAVSWDGDALTFSIDEVTVPWPSRIRGKLRVHPTALPEQGFALDEQRHHHWLPIAPVARIEVELEHPAMRWSGTGYLDSNRGSAPLEQAFSSWTWSRASVRGGTGIIYDVERRDGPPLSLALFCDEAGRVRHFQAPLPVPLPRTGWRIDRSTRVDAGHRANLLETLEDTPFYARSTLATHLMGKPVTAIHESLSLKRFSAPWVRMLLPFRMPRWTA